MDNTELITTWCRMWSEDPALAHKTMTDTAVQWSGQTPGLDTVVGPAEQERFVTAYRAQHINVFTPRLLVTADDSCAYTWDVAAPDGSIRTGLDINVLRDGLIEQNWTFVGPGRDEQPDPGPVPATAESLRRLTGQWLRDRSPDAAVHREPVLDPRSGRVAVMWTAGADGIGGAALLATRDGQVVQAWSFTASRPFRY